MSDLKPCPFCGSEAIVPAMPIGITDDDTPVECTNLYCNASDVTFDKGAWNTRPIEDALQARIESLEAEVAALTLLHTQATDEMLKMQNRVHELEAENAKLRADNRSLVEQVNQMALRIEHKSGTAKRGYK